MRPMNEAPRDRTRILIKRKVYLYETHRVKGFQDSRWEHAGDRWEECWWDTRDTGSGPRWQPWSGNYRVSSTDSFGDADAHGWMPVSWCEDGYSNVLATIARSLGAFGNSALAAVINQQVQSLDNIQLIGAINEGLLAIADDLTRGPER